MPLGIDINWVKEGHTLGGMLEQGELDASFGFPPPPLGASRNLPIRRLMQDGGKEVTLKFFQQEGVIPVNHVVIIQNRVLREHPWVAQELYWSFQESKQKAYERAKQLSHSYLLFEGRDSQDQATQFGDDPYPLGMKANEKTLTMLFENTFDQGLTKRLITFEEFFYSSVMDT